MNENFSNTTSQTKSNGKWVAKEAGNKVGEVATRTEDLSKDLTAKIEDRAGDVMARGREFADRATEAFGSYSKDATQFVRQYPIQIAVGALAVGFVAGMALCRKK